LAACSPAPSAPGEKFILPFTDTPLAGILTETEELVVLGSTPTSEPSKPIEAIISIPTLEPPKSTEAIVSTPTIIPSPTEDNRLEPYYWRNWQVVPDFSPNARQILIRAMQNSDIDIHSFSKVGDCQMTCGTFLGGYVRNQYRIPSGFEATVVWFSESMIRDGVTSYGGLGVNSILNPMFAYAAGYKECDPKETPLSCELRITRPAVVVIGLGTNWKPYAETSFEEHLRRVVDQVLASGALPILSTKADNVELDWKLNLAIAKIAYDYDIPLVNVWRAVQDLPNRGLMEPPKQIYLTPDGWMRRNQAWLSTLQAVYLIVNEE